MFGRILYTFPLNALIFRKTQSWHDITEHFLQTHTNGFGFCSLVLPNMVYIDSFFFIYFFPIFMSCSTNISRTTLDIIMYKSLIDTEKKITCLTYLNILFHCQPIYGRQLDTGPKSFTPDRNMPNIIIYINIRFVSIKRPIINLPMFDWGVLFYVAS